MTKVIHGGDIYQYSEKMIDFSSNINPLGIPETAREVLNGAWEHLERYPDLHYTSLREAIANFHQLSSDQILVGNGAAEIIFLIGRLFQDKKALIPMPTFGEYQEAVQLAGGQIEMVYRKSENDFALPMEEILDRLNDVDGIILCHPNNPSGGLVEEKELIQLIERTRQCNKLLILDEAFIDFVSNPDEVSGKQWLKDHPTMLIIRAFTKFFAMPGLRLGYGIGSSQLIDDLQEMQMPWSVNSLAVEIGERVLFDSDYIKRSQKWMEEERTFLCETLSRNQNLHVFPTETNFILCKIKKTNLTAQMLKERMIEQGILIRDASSFDGLDDSFFRVAIKDHENNKKLCQALQATIQTN